MAVYKVIQDIEAEDKLIGFLTLKGFIYAAITVFLGFINFRLLTAAGMGGMRWALLAIFLPPMILFGVLSSPLGRDQPTEVWLLSHIKFLLKPRKKIWNQSGLKQLVMITAPKKIEKYFDKNLSPTEVKSRLQALASTLDSHGWAIKNVSVNDSSLMSYLQAQAGNSDRLVNSSSIIVDEPVDVHPSDDILDERNNAKAQQIDAMLQQQDAQRKRVINDIATAKVPPPQAAPAPPPPNPAQSTPPIQTAKLKELAQSGNALSVAAVAKLANSHEQIQQIGPNEVVISLH